MSIFTAIRTGLDRVVTSLEGPAASPEASKCEGFLELRRDSLGMARLATVMSLVDSGYGNVAAGYTEKARMAESRVTSMGHSACLEAGRHVESKTIQIAT